MKEAFYAPDYQPSETDLGTSSSSQWTRILRLPPGHPRAVRGPHSAGEHRLGQRRRHRLRLRPGRQPHLGQRVGHRPVPVLSVRLSGPAHRRWSQGKAGCDASAPGTTGIGGPAPYQQTLSYDQTGTANGSTDGTSGQITSSTLVTGAGHRDHHRHQLQLPGRRRRPAARPGHRINDRQPRHARGHRPDLEQRRATRLHHGRRHHHCRLQLGRRRRRPRPARQRHHRRRHHQLPLRRRRQSAAHPGRHRQHRRHHLVPARRGAIGHRRHHHRHPLLHLRRPGHRRPHRHHRIRHPDPGLVIADPQGTDTAAINTANQAVTEQYDTPFGVPLANIPSTAAWPGNRGYVGGTTDTATGLTNLGAREYNPARQTFISPDSIISYYNPQDLDPYTYAYDNPATNSDPTGLSPTGPNNTCGNQGTGYNYDCSSASIDDYSDSIASSFATLGDDAWKGIAGIASGASALISLGMGYLANQVSQADLNTCNAIGAAGDCAGAPPQRNLGAILGNPLGLSRHYTGTLPYKVGYSAGLAASVGGGDGDDDLLTSAADPGAGSAIARAISPASRLIGPSRDVAGEVWGALRGATPRSLLAAARLGSQRIFPIHAVWDTRYRLFRIFQSSGFCGLRDGCRFLRQRHLVRWHERVASSDFEQHGQRCHRCPNDDRCPQDNP